MKYRVEISPKALAEVEAAHRWLSARSPEAAERWQAALLKAIDTLEKLPERCPRAPESGFLNAEIRQLLHGKQRGVYRILFEIRGETVRVLRVRHGARRFLDDE